MMKYFYKVALCIVIVISLFGCVRRAAREKVGVFTPRPIATQYRAMPALPSAPVAMRAPPAVAAAPPPYRVTPPAQPRQQPAMPLAIQKTRASDVAVRTTIKTAPPTIPKKSEIIVIDPGHGGEDFGTHSNSKPRYQEKSLNLATSMQLKAFLEQLGYQIIMTRKDDIFIELSKRAEFANEKKPTLFVSVHYNSAPSKDADGIEVYYYEKDENKKRVTESKKLAQNVLKSVIAQTEAKSRGVKHGNFAVIRETKMPAILIEAGFLTNDGEMEKIKNPTYIKQIAWGIAKGIDAYLQS